MSENLEMAVEGFLAHKRGIGRKYHSEEHELRLLLRFAGEHRARPAASLRALREFISVMSGVSAAGRGGGRSSTRRGSRGA